jgi:hypothetical protein
LKASDSSHKLQAEVYAALTELGKTVDEVTCTGSQFPGQWNNLAGMRVAPYACDFTKKWLSVNAGLEHGRTIPLGTLAGQAMRQPSTGASPGAWYEAPPMGCGCE